MMFNKNHKGFVSVGLIAIVAVAMLTISAIPMIKNIEIEDIKEPVVENEQFNKETTIKSTNKPIKVEYEALSTNKEYSLNSNSAETKFDLIVDDNIETGSVEHKSKEEIQEELNQKVRDGMINTSINLNPVFNSSNATDELHIVNENCNKHPQIVQIYLKNNNRMLYQSELIPVGSRIDSAKLDVNLEAGDYACIACFNSIDENNGDMLGKACADMRIVIESN